jgi:tetratricopeptide (TPR) repeat protein
MLGEFIGHDQKVTAVAASPDGQLVASGSQNGVVKTWDVATNMELCTFRGHQDRITGIAFVGDRWIITASADGSAKAWDATSGKEGLPSPKTAHSPSSPSTDPREKQAAEYAKLIQEANDLSNQQNYSKAIEKFREAIRLRPHYAELHSCMGDCLFAAGKVPEAIESFRTAVRLQPDSGWYNYNLGIALLSIDRNREAITALKKGRDLFPDLFPLRLALGNALSHEKQYTDAIAEFQAAIKLKPQSAKAHHGLAVAHGQLQQWGPAKKELQKTIDLDCKYAPAYSDMIEVLLASGTSQQAARWAEQAQVYDVSIRPDTLKKLQQAP